MKSVNVLKEVKILYDLGFAIIWIQPKGKRPITSGWTTGPRTTWEELKRTYLVGYNVGVRTGEASQVFGNYLAVIDVDIKSPEFLPKALEKVKQMTGGVSCPVVLSGSGNGSRHIYCKTIKPFKMWHALKEEGGEVAVYSTGRQMVLPPSVTKCPYKWDVPITNFESLPLLNLDIGGLVAEIKKEKKERTTNEKVFDFDFTELPHIELDWLDIPKEVLLAITKGKGVTDRSSYLLKASKALLSAGLNTNEILNVLTDKVHYLSACAFEHAQTTSRARAAHWLSRYTLRKVVEETESQSAKVIFSEYKEPAVLTKEQIKIQTEEMEKELESEDWRDEIIRGGQNGTGGPKSLVQNVVLILKNAVHPSLCARNLFANRDTYTMNTPWGGRVGDLISDDDTIKIKYWLGKQWNFEPKNTTIDEAMILIATENGYDPVKDMLNVLPAWDGVKRLDTWLVDHFEAKGDRDYLAQVFRKWMFAMVMRAFEPGAKFDWMPIFEGIQGVGKSSFGRKLVGDKFFLDWLPNLADKDSALSLQGMWSVEMGELSQFKKIELETIKGFMTRTIDKVRPPYGKRMLESPRRCVFFGTTNKETYLRDDTGNRRFKPVRVGRLDFDALDRDREQLFAEAKYLYDNKLETAFTLDIIGEAREYEKRIHAAKMIEDDATAMMILIKDWHEKGIYDDDFDTNKFQIQELFQGGGPLQKWRFDGRTVQFVAKALKMMGATSRKIKGLKRWKMPEGEGFL